MTFEEFFKKKRIDTASLQKGEPALFSEFKAHYEQMGEKSFDHTKKYWFNKIRRQFPLLIEVKTEKVKIENPLAEQTVTEKLLEEAPSLAVPSPKLGFVPKFKASSAPKSIIEDQTQETAEKNFAAEPTDENKPVQPYKPRFNIKSVPPKPVDEQPQLKEPDKNSIAETPAENKPAQPYKPRFSMKNIPPKPAEE